MKKETVGQRKKAKGQISKLVKKAHQAISSAPALKSTGIKKNDFVEYKDLASRNPTPPGLVNDKERQRWEAQHKVGKVVAVFHNGRYVDVKWNGSQHHAEAVLGSALKLMKRKGQKRVVQSEKEVK